MLCKCAQMGTCQVIELQLWPVSDHELYGRRVSIYCNYYMRLKTMQSSGCNQQWLRHWRNDI